MESNNQTAYKLAYRYTIHVIKPFDQRTIYVSAKTGNILENWSNLAYCSHHEEFPSGLPKQKNHLEKLMFNQSALILGNADTRYNGSQAVETEFFEGKYRLHDNSRASGGIITRYGYFNFPNPPSDFFDNDNNWSNLEYDNTTIDNSVFDAHWAAGETYDYFKEIFDRDSWDGQGSSIQLFVENEGNFGGFAAFSAIQKDALTGEFTRVSHVIQKPFTSVDIIAHEITHAINAATSDLSAVGLSGALNEGFSEIWAACVKHFIDSSSRIWQHSNTFNTSYFSNLANPKESSNPDTYEGEFWENPNCNPNVGSFGCGVHNNSTVLSHWFYLLSEGSAQTDEINDNGDIFQVDGIGIDKAARIAYRLETVYLTRNSSFYGTRNLGIQAAEDLYGIGSPEVIATQNAFHAVGLGVANNPNCDLINITTLNQSIVLENLTTPVEILKIYDESFNLVFECNGDCADRQVIDNLSNGNYNIDLRLMTENYETICSITQSVTIGPTNLPCDNLGGDTDNDGICNQNDCAPQDPALPAEVGTPCNDDNPNTTDDKIGADGCTCAGSPIDGGGTSNTCEDLQFISDNTQIIVTGLTSSSKVELFGEKTNWQAVVICEGNCTTTQATADLENGIYTVKVNFLGNDGAYCYRQENITIANDNDGNNSGDSEIANCDALSFTGEPEQITVTGLTAETNKVEIIGENTDWKIVSICDGNCAVNQVIPNLMTGEYTVKVNQGGNDNSYCYREEKVRVGSSNGNGGFANCDNLAFNTQDGKIIIEGLSASYNKVEIIGQNTDWRVITICDGDCSDTQMIPNLADGMYQVKVNQGGNDNSYCYREEKVRVSSSNGNGGFANCDNLAFNTQDGKIIIEGLSASYNKVEIIGRNTDWRVITICDGDCSDTQMIPDLVDGMYQVKVNQGGNDDSYCYREEKVAVTNSSHSRNRSLSFQTQLTLYPNPARDQLTIESHHLGDKTGIVQIFNAFGEVVQQLPNVQWKNGSVTLPLYRYENGLYWLTVQTDGQTRVTKRFVVEHWR